MEDDLSSDRVRPRRLRRCARSAPSPIHPVTDTLHGVAITDPYRWLEDQNSPKTRAWLDAQIQYTRTFLGHIPVRDKVKQRLAQLSRIDSYGFPAERHGPLPLQPPSGE